MPVIRQEESQGDTTTTVTPTQLLPRPVSRDSLPDSQESYTEHWRRISRQSGEFRPATSPPSRSSLRSSTPAPASPTAGQQALASRPRYHIVETPYRSEERIAYRPGIQSLDLTRPEDSGRLHITRSASAPDLRDGVLVGPRLAHKPTPRRVYIPDPAAQYRTNFTVKNGAVKPEPGCCGLCEVSSAATVGSWVGGWLTGVFKVILTGAVAGCAAKMCSGG